MASQKRPSTRKSIGYLPSPDLDSSLGDQENLGSELLQQAGISTLETKSKKSRSKSLGPGGLDALKEDAGNKRKVGALPKSILKPTIPLSPLREIPSRKPSSPAKDAAAASKPTISTPTSPSKRPLTFGSPSKQPAASLNKSPSPRKARPSPQKGNEIPQDTRLEERQKQKDAIQKQRDARRKSMANRRVSFAPEATLHTFENLEDLQDSTTSSASTNSTRRASQFAAPTASEPTTPDREEDSGPPDSTRAKQRDSNQKRRRRRSSGIPPMNFNDPDEALSSSPQTVGDDDNRNASKDHIQVARSPARKVKGPDETQQDLLDFDEPIVEQDHNEASTSGQATDGDVQTHTEAFDDDEAGNTMEMVGDEITAAFQPWVQQLVRSSSSASRFITTLDQENVDPFSPAFRANHSPAAAASPARSIQDNGDMSMDITRAIGGIVNPSSNQRQDSRSHDRRRSSGGSSMSGGDGTMDFTTAIGGIQRRDSVDDALADDNEDLSMEFTSVLGGIQGRRRSLAAVSSDQPGRLQTVREQSFDEEDGSGNTMEMTTALGHIEPRVNSRADEEDTGRMDMTQAVGTILPSAASNGPNQLNVFERLSASAKTSPSRSPLGKSSTPHSRTRTSISATGSPALSAPRSRGRPRKSDSGLLGSSPPKGLKTPPQQMTPQAARPTTPAKTPPANISMRHPSPKRLFDKEIKQAKSSPAVQSPALFDKNDLTGGHTPRVRLMPKIKINRRASGIGFDKEGLGSPQVAALLDRRASISDQADIFAPQAVESRGVRFQDPRTLEADELREREEAERRESGQFILQAEADDASADDRDVTMTLKDAISSMTPKKSAPKPAKGRKSLAVGSARGLLGKRPHELDDDDEEGTPGGLKGREASPMKKIRLQAPPSASETTGRMFRQSLGPTSGNDRPMTPVGESPAKNLASTPSHQGHFKDVESLPSAQKPLPVFGQSAKVSESNIAVEADEQRIGLQDFLNMTSIRFMELNTTKRRHTMAPTKTLGLADHSDVDVQDPAKRFEDAVVAGACTLPMLELYQHSCRELKKYISEGRNIVREIEVSTGEENPPLFQEYVSATPTNRSIMDNQFKNMKTHARHLSKGMWYEWRMKLLEGLREVLLAEAESLIGDNDLLVEQETVLQESLPALLGQHEQLRDECAELQQRASELADCDQDELAQSRQQLISTNQELRRKQDRLAALRSRSQQLDTSLEDAQDAKIEHLQAIQEASRVREQYRGWSAAEVSNVRDQVESLEAEHGWSVTSASESRLTMVCQSQLELSFDVAAFAPLAVQGSQNAPIRLSYTADHNAHKPLPLTTEKRFFLQLLRAHLHSITQHETIVSDLLAFVSASWTQCLALSEEIHRLDLERITHCDILSDERLAVRSMLLIPSVSTKVNVTFEIGVAAKAMAAEVNLKARAEVAYGEQYREDKMRDFLKTRISEGMGAGRGSWADAVRELGKKLIQRGKK